MKLLTLEDINTVHLTLLAKMVKICPYGTTPKILLEEACAGKIQLWEVENGIVVTSLKIHPNGLELHIRGFEGVTNIKETYRKLKEQAKKYNAKWVGGCVGNPRIAKLAKKLGSNQIATIMLQEV